MLQYETRAPRWLTSEFEAPLGKISRYFKWGKIDVNSTQESVDEKRLDKDLTHPVYTL